MGRNRLVQLLALAVIVACVVGGGITSQQVRAQRKTLQLGLEGELDKSAPPSAVLAYTIFGSFRGMIVDALWYRATRLKEEGKFFEAYHLAEMITTLMRNFPDVWQFHAWNMAYNISVATHTPHERWDWVNKGIRLLREEGIQLNPNSEMLYKELAWIFFHKVGGNADDQHWYYKRRLAFEWHEFLGTVTEGRTTEQAATAFRTVVQAPDTLDAWLAANPDDGPALIQRIRSIGYEPDERFLRQLGYHSMFRYSANAAVLGFAAGADQSRFDPRVLEFIEDPAIAPVRARLVSYLQKKVLRERYRMKPDFMLELIEAYGPLDWRHPSAHGLYWSELGVRVAEGARYKADIDLLNLNRQSMHALQDLSKTGRLSYDPVGPPGSFGNLYRGPEPEFYIAYDNALANATARLSTGDYRSDNYDAFKAGHENFILGAIASSYLSGRRTIAMRMYERARQLYAQDKPQRYAQGMEELIWDTLQETVTNQADAERFIYERLTVAFGEGMAFQRGDLFNANVQLAQQIHQRIQDRAQGNATVVQDPKMLLPFGEVVKHVFQLYMTDPRYDPLIRGRVWQLAPIELRRDTYNFIKPRLVPQAQAMGLDIDRLLPPPPAPPEETPAP